MELSSPVRQNSTTYIASVQTTKFLDIKYPSTLSGSNTSPPTNQLEMKQYLSAIAVMYESYSTKWFNKKIPAFYFIQNVTHRWDYSSTPPYTSPPNFVGSEILVHQIWRPETILIQPTLFQINWVLQTSDYSSYSVANRSPGTTQESEEIPYSDDQTHFNLKETFRSVLHRKIRKAKLVAAVAKLRVKKLYLKYYTDYGEFTESDEESVLSSDSEN